ncbi:MAG: metal ABC transporter solute-binding protein, Zn/Mn family [Solirubrobacterales bacterium]
MRSPSFTRSPVARPRSASSSRLLALFTLLAIPLALLATGCGGGGATTAGDGRLNVVAAENFWGSIAEQLGGQEVAVRNIIDSPAADPHDYEPTSADAQAFAGAQVAIVNGIGYDEWASKLLEASPDSSRVEVNVGAVVGLENGDNPHQWYSPRSVHRVIDAIVAAYERALPGKERYFQLQKARFEGAGLAEYDRLIARIKSRYGGSPVGASESIFEPLAPALGLRLITPRGFMDAVSEGTEATPAEKASGNAQIEDGEIDLWVYNSQNATPDVKRLNEAAEAAGIPIATVTETLTPANATFEQWMVAELQGIEAALAAGSGS